MVTTPELEIVDLTEGQKNAATAVNAQTQILDALVQLWVIDAVPPTTPPVSGVVNGSRYIVPVGATGDWANQDLKVADWESGWTFLTPRPGWRCYDARRKRMMLFLGEHGGGGRWQAFQATRLAELTDSTTGTPGSSLVAIIGSGDDTSINNNFATLNKQGNDLLDILITAHLMAADQITKIVNEAIAIVETVISKKNP